MIQTSKCSLRDRRSGAAIDATQHFIVEHHFAAILITVCIFPETPLLWGQQMVHSNIFTVGINVRTNRASAKRSILLPMPSSKAVVLSSVYSPCATHNKREAKDRRILEGTGTYCRWPHRTLQTRSR
jgi:hypothetical protein